MPGYRKVDQAALAAKAEKELAYQRSYARSQRAALQGDETTGKISSKEARTRRSAYNRVIGQPEVPPAKPSQSALSSLAEGLHRLFSFGGKISKGAEELKALPSKMPKRKKER